MNEIIIWIIRMQHLIELASLLQQTPVIEKYEAASRCRDGYNTTHRRTPPQEQLRRVDWKVVWLSSVWPTLLWIWDFLGMMDVNLKLCWPISSNKVEWKLWLQPSIEQHPVKQQALILRPNTSLTVTPFFFWPMHSRLPSVTLHLVAVFIFQLDPHLASQDTSTLVCLSSIPTVSNAISHLKCSPPSMSSFEARDHRVSIFCHWFLSHVSVDGCYTVFEDGNAIYWSKPFIWVSYCCVNSRKLVTHLGWNPKLSRDDHLFLYAHCPGDLWIFGE